MTNHDNMRARAAVAAVAAVLMAAGCSGGDDEPDADLDELGQELADDGMAVLDEFRTDEPRMGEVTSENQTEDAMADVQCDGGVQRVWGADFTLAWPGGDPQDMDDVDTLLDGTADFLSGAFGDRGYSAESQEMGDGDQPRSAVYQRTAGDEESTLEFTVDYGLAAEQAGDETVTAEFSITGSTPCVS